MLQPEARGVHRVLFVVFNGRFTCFWQRDDRSYGRELTAEETVRFFELTGIILHQ